MTAETFIGLANHIAMLFALAVLYNAVGKKRKPERKIDDFALGVIIGLTGLLIMANQWQVVPGVFLDIRSILFSLAGFFFGLIPTAIAALMAIFLRIYQGGTGVLAGIMLVVTSAGLGLLWRYLRKNRSTSPAWMEFFFFGVVVHLSVLGWALVLPLHVRYQAIKEISAVVMFLFPLGTAVLGKFFGNQKERSRVEEELLESETRYRNLFENSFAVMLLIDPEQGSIVDANSAASSFYGLTKEVLKQKKLSDISALSPNEIDAITAKVKSEQRHHSESCHRLDDGTVRDVEVFSVQIQVLGQSLIYSIIHDITERKRAEKALKESEALFRSLVEHAPDAIYVRVKNRFTYVNPAAIRLFGGASAADLLDCPVLDFVHPDYHSEVRDRIEQLEEGRKDIPPQAQIYLRLDGGKLDVEAYPVPICYEGENGALLIVRDITERKRMEEALRQERDLFSAGPVFTIGWSPEKPWSVTQVSSNVRDILGYSPEEMTHPDFCYVDLIHPDDLSGIIREVETYLGNGVDSFEQDYRLRNKEGDYRWFHDFSRLVRNEGGEVISIRGYMVDLTLQKEVEQRLAEERQCLANVIDGTSAGIWEWNVQTGQVVVNENWAQMIGYSLDALSPVTVNTWRKVVHPDDLPKFEMALRAHFSGETDNFDCEVRVRHKDGHLVWVQSRGRVITWFDQGKPLNMYGINTDITQRKRVEEELVFEREQLLSLFDSIDEAIYVVDPFSYEILYVNPAIKRKLGRDVVNGICYREFQGLDAPCDFCTNEIILKQKPEPYRWEFDNPLLKRSYVVFDRIITWPDGRDVRFELAIDITERKRAEEALKEREATLKGIFQAAPVGIVLIRDRVFRWVSGSVLDLTGYSEEELVGKSTRLLYENDAEFERVGEVVYGSIPGREISKVESRCRRKDGTFVDVLVHLAPLNPADFSEGIIGAAVDISAQKKSQELLRDSEATYRTLFNAGMVAISIQDVADLSFIDVNTVFMDVYGYTPEELHALHPVHFGTLDDDADAESCQELRGRVMAGEIVSMEISDRKKDGSSVMMDKSICMVNLNGIDRIMTVAQDVTERKMLREIMVQTEKIMSLGGLAAGMAHEINNPLTIILQGVQNITRRIGESLPANLEAADQCGVDLDALKEYLQKRNVFHSLGVVREAAERAAGIVENMLDFSRKNEALSAFQDVNRILEKAIALARTDYDLKKKYDFRNAEILTAFSQLPSVLCVETEIEQVILNLLRNAGQSLNEAGRAKPLIRIRTWPEGEWVVIEVEDNGLGMSPEVRERIFEPFFTTKHSGEGTGLGLSVSFHIIVQRHGGEMTVDSKPGEWTRFRIRLPISHE